MAIQYFDAGRAMGNALAGAAAFNQIRERDQMRNFLAQNGDALMSGDSAALGAYAQYDPGSAFTMRRQMDADARAKAAEGRDVAEHQLRMQQAISAMSADERAQAAEEIANGLRGAAFFYSKGDEAGYNQFLTENEIDPAQFPFGQFPAHAAQFEDVLTALTTFDERNAGPKADDQRARKIADYQRIYGYDEATATALADGIVEVSRDPLTGEATLVDKRSLFSGQNAATETPQGPDQSAQPPLSFNLPGVNDSFGVEGFGKGLANTVFDVAGAQVPFQDVQEAQSDFAVLREDILSDLANGYRRQPPSWVLQALDGLTPRAGNVTEGTQKAQSKLRALDRKFEREIGLVQQQLKRRMKPADRAEIEGQLTSLQAARSRVQGMLGAFDGGSGASGIPQLFLDGVGDLPDGLTAADVWAEMSDDEKAAFQQ